MTLDEMIVMAYYCCEDLEEMQTFDENNFLIKLTF